MRLQESNPSAGHRKNTQRQELLEYLVKRVPHKIERHTVGTRKAWQSNVKQNVPSIVPSMFAPQPTSI